MKVKFGCGCALTVAVVCGIVTVILVAIAYSFLGSAVNTLESAPKPLPLPEITDEVESAISKVDETFQKVVDGHEGGTLTMDAGTLNAWLRMSSRSELRFIAEHASFEIADSMVEADLSIPLAPIGAPGRYFNGHGTFRVVLKDGVPYFNVEKLTPSNGTSQAIEQLVRMFEGVNFAPYLKLEELVGADLLERCNAEVAASVINISCRRGGPGGTSLEAAPATTETAAVETPHT